MLKSVYIVPTMLMILSLLFHSCNNPEHKGPVLSQEEQTSRNHTQTEKNEPVLVQENELVRDGLSLAIEKKESRKGSIDFRYTLTNTSRDTLRVLRPELETNFRIGIFNVFFQNKRGNRLLLRYGEFRDGKFLMQTVDLGPCILSANTTVVVAPGAIYTNSLHIDISKTVMKHTHGTFEMSCELNLRHTDFITTATLPHFPVFAGTVTSNSISVQL